MTIATYQGWTNHATWMVNLWLTNDQGSVDFINETVDYLFETGDGCRAHVRAELAEFIESHIRDGNPHKSEQSGCNVYTDLIESALSDVNWDEIAMEWLED